MTELSAAVVAEDLRALAEFGGLDAATVAMLGRAAELVDSLVTATTDAYAEALVAQTQLKGMTVEEGAAVLELGPPRELVIAWVNAARDMLGDAPNYSETRIDFPRTSMEFSAAGERDRYVFTVQRAGKVTPHEARQAAEAERDRLASQRASVLALHAPEHVTFHGGRVEQTCKHCDTGDPYCTVSMDWPCPTVEALGVNQ